jgi:hypothetical protein
MPIANNNRHHPVRDGNVMETGITGVGVIRNTIHAQA